MTLAEVEAILGEEGNEISSRRRWFWKQTTDGTVVVVHFNQGVVLDEKFAQPSENILAKLRRWLGLPASD